MLGILRKIPYPLLPSTAKTCEFLFLRQIPLNKIILFPYSCHPQSAELGGPVFANSVVSSMNGCLGGWMVVSWIRIRQRCHSALDWLKSWQEKEGGKGAVEKVEKNSSKYFPGFRLLRCRASRASASITFLHHDGRLRLRVNSCFTVPYIVQCIM